MLRTTSASSRRAFRAYVLGAATLTSAIVYTGAAEARHHHRHRSHHSSHHESGDSYNPAFASIIVAGNSGATLEAKEPDGLPQPASLTKIMSLHLLFERLE